MPSKWRKWRLVKKYNLLNYTFLSWVVNIWDRVPGSRGPLGRSACWRVPGWVGTRPCSPWRAWSARRLLGTQPLASERQCQDPGRCGTLNPWAARSATGDRAFEPYQNQGSLTKINKFVATARFSKILWNFCRVLNSWNIIRCTNKFSSHTEDTGDLIHTVWRPS